MVINLSCGLVVVYAFPSIKRNMRQNEGQERYRRWMILPTHCRELQSYHRYTMCIYYPIRLKALKTMHLPYNKHKQLASNWSSVHWETQETLFIFMSIKCVCFILCVRNIIQQCCLRSNHKELFFNTCDNSFCVYLRHHSYTYINNETLLHPCNILLV